MKPIKLHPAEVKLASLQTVIKSSLTEGDKLFLIDVIQTYLPREGLENAGDEIMETLLDTELTWAERVLTAVSLTDIQIPETNGESANAG